MTKFLKFPKTHFLLIIVTILFFLTNNLRAEKLKDYFIPIYPLKKATYIIKNNNTGIADMIRNITYFKKGKFYGVRINQTFEGNAVLMSSDLYEITSDEVRLLKTDSVNIMGKTSKTYNYPIIILKAPKTGKPITWTRLRPSKTKYTASFITVIINGQKRKAIKLTKVHSGFEDTGTVDIYVKDIGFWKSGVLNSDGTYIEMFVLKNIR